MLIEIRRAKNMWLNACKKKTFEYFWDEIKVRNRTVTGGSGFVKTNSSTTATSCPWAVNVDGLYSLLPRAWSFVFCQLTSSPRDAASVAIVSSTSTEFQVARQEKRHCRQSPSLKKSADQMTLNSWLTQQFFPAAVAKVWCQHAPLANSRFNWTKRSQI